MCLTANNFELQEENINISERERERERGGGRGKGRGLKGGRERDGHKEGGRCNAL